MARNLKGLRSYFRSTPLMSSALAAVLALTPIAVSHGSELRNRASRAPSVKGIGDRQPGQSTSGHAPIAYVVGWLTGPSCPNGHCNFWAPGTYWAIDTGNGRRLSLSHKPRFSEAETFGMVIAPNGVKGYVTADTDGTVTPVDLRTNRPYVAVPLGCTPLASAIVPSGRFLYVLCYGGTVRPLATRTDRLGAPIRVPGGSSSIAASPDGRWVAVTAPRGIWLIDTQTDRLRAKVALHGTPTYLVFDPTGEVAYVVDGTAIVSINMSSMLPTSRISIRLRRGDVPSGFVMAPDGLKAYVVTYNEYGDSGSVVPIDLSRGVAAPFKVLRSLRPADVAITPDSKDLYIASPYNGEVAEFAVATSRVIARSAGLDNPTAIAIGP